MQHDAFLSAISRFASIPRTKLQLLATISHGLSAKQRDAILQRLCLIEARMQVATQEMAEACDAMHTLVRKTKRAARKIEERDDSEEKISTAKTNLESMLS